MWGLTSSRSRPFERELDLTVKLDYADVTAIVVLAQYLFVILMVEQWSQLYGLVLLQLNESAGVTSVQLSHVRRHRVQAIEERLVLMINDKSVLIVWILVANLRIHIVQAWLNDSQMAAIVGEVLLPLGVRVRRLLADIQLMR